jgi:hypothetical protein
MALSSLINNNMSLAISRLTDTGEGEECADEREAHQKYTTTYTSGSTSVFINNLAVTTVTSTGEQSCGDGHTSTALTGSVTVFVENLGVHRITDFGEGQLGDTYESLTGSPDVFAG